MKRYIIVAFLGVFAAQLWAEDSSFIVVDFETVTAGRLHAKSVENLFGELVWESLEGRASVVDDSTGKVMEVIFPKGKAASKESGAQFVVELPKSRYATLTYRFRPAKGFPFVKGGKLPGLASGGSQFTGGRPPGIEGGWSCRYMWRREGELELYFYHPDMEGDYGERHSLKTRLKPGEWTEVTQKIDTGVKGLRKGKIEIEVNGETKLRLSQLELHGTVHGPLDSFLFSTFFGGNSKDWAPPIETTMRFDDFRFSPEKPVFSGD